MAPLIISPLAFFAIHQREGSPDEFSLWAAKRKKSEQTLFPFPGEMAHFPRFLREIGLFRKKVLQTEQSVLIEKKPTFFGHKMISQTSFVMYVLLFRGECLILFFQGHCFLSDLLAGLGHYCMFRAGPGMYNNVEVGIVHINKWALNCCIGILQFDTPP